MAVTAITLLVLRCRDIERSRAFYESLGLELSVEQHASGPRHYSARLGSVVLELYPYSGVESRGARLGLRVAELQAALASAEQHGGRVVRGGSTQGGLESSASGDSLPTTAVLEDPDGHRVELTEGA